MVKRKGIYYFGEKNCRNPINRRKGYISLPKKAFKVYATNFLLSLASFIFIEIAKRFDTLDTCFDHYVLTGHYFLKLNKYN